MNITIEDTGIALGRHLQSTKKAWNVMRFMVADGRSGGKGCSSILGAQLDRFGMLNSKEKN